MRVMLSIIHKKHKDRYRIRFCDENFYCEHQLHFQEWKMRLFGLSDVEKIQAWVVALSCLRRPQDWYGGPRAQLIYPNKNFAHKLTLRQLFEGTSIMIPPKINSTLNIFDFLNGHRIKALPESCFRSLCFMVDSTYPIKITSGVVSPFELLKIQLSGERIVSIDEDFTTWPTRLYSGRDFLGFILHDLIHADHFFRESNHRDAQLGFYRFVNTLLTDEVVLDLLTRDDFKDGFEYIIADMNSHPLHLFQTLHSLLFKSLKNDEMALNVWQNWVSRLNLETSINESLLKVNSQDFSVENAVVVENFSRQFGLQ